MPTQESNHDARGPRRGRPSREKAAGRLTPDGAGEGRDELHEGALAAIVSSSVDAIYGKDLAGIVTTWNDAATRLYGYPAAEAVGRSVEDLLVPVDRREELRTLLERLRRDERVEPLETVRLRKDGVPIEVSLTISPVRRRDGVTVGAAVIARDVSDRRRAAEELRRSEERLNLALSAAEIGTWDWHRADGERLRWDERTSGLFGIPAERRRGSYRELLAVVLPSDRRALEAAVARCLAGAEELDVEVAVRCADGEVRVLRLRGRCDHEGAEARRLTGVCWDVTERRRAEEALRQADRRKDQFLAILGHELRNPLAPIRSSLDILRLQQPGSPDAVLATLDRQVQHLTRLVDDMLDISRISRGKVLLRPERLDLSALVAATVEDHRAGFVERDLGLTVAVPGPRWIDGDPTRLAQALGNLLQNARKYTEPGGTVRVEVGAGLPGQVTVSVRDDGIGIAEAALAGLFEPFVAQPERAPGRGPGGLGLGLAVVRGLVELHGGAVAATSAGPGRGSEFTICLPFAGVGAVAAPAAAQPAVASPEEPGRRRILVVDDHLDGARSLGLLLELRGHEVRLAFDGSAAVALAREFQPDIVLCDIGLPGDLDGYGVARALRQEPELKGILLVALTGFGLDEDRRMALAAGFDTHFTKPADPEALHRLVVASRARGPAATGSG